MPAAFPELTPYETYVAPFIRDADIILPAFVMWFVVQYFTQFVVVPVLCAVTGRNKKVASGALKPLTGEEKRSFAVRMCAVVNGLIMFRSAFFFLDGLMANNWQLQGRDHYAPIPGYRPFRLVIVAYFLWDIVVCVVYRWGALWTIHGIAAFLGTYFLAFPFSDHYGTYYSGMFETSNAFLHLATMLRMFDVGYGVAAAFEGLFALMFLVIRVVGGTIVTYLWCDEMIFRFLLAEGPRQYHAAGPIIVCLVNVVIVMILQYVWFGEIVRKVAAMFTGGGSSDAAAAKKTDGDAATKATATSPAKKPARAAARKEA